MRQMPQVVTAMRNRHKLQESEQTAVSPTPRTLYGRAHLISCLRRINELAEEVERLRSAVDGHRTETSASSMPGGLGPQSNHINGSQQQPPILHSQPPLFPQQSNSSPQDQSSSTRFALSTPASAPSPAGYSRSLEHINLDKDRINGLFQM